MARRLSPLELLHPNGVSELPLVLGSACPAGLRPEHGALQLSELSDLIVVAPTRSELRTSGWLPGAARLASEMLAENGVVYVLSPRGWRGRTVRTLSSQGLVLAASLAHLPDLDESRYVVPLTIGPASYAFSSLIPIAAWKRRLVLPALSRSEGRHLLARSLPAMGFAMHRPDAPPLFDWLSRLEGGAASDTTAILTTSWRGAEGSFVLHRFSAEGRRPSAVAKIGLPSPISEDRVDEAKILRRLASGARQAGADVPEPLLVASWSGRPLMLQSAVSGRSAAVILAEAPQQLFDVSSRLVEWLQRWNQQSLEGEFTEERLARELVAPARLLAPLFEEGARYAERLEARCAALAGDPVPSTATHNDLTMANLFLDGAGRLSVVDWEAGRGDGLPLVDFYYAMADAAAASSRYTDRLQAFLDCFTREGKNAAAIGQLEGRLRRALRLSPPVAELCFHACWLHHAANENRMSHGSSPRPFLSILRSVASDAFSRLHETQR